MEYRIQRLKEDLTLAQQRNKRQRKQLANYTKAYKNKCNECNEYKQALNKIRKLCNNEKYIFQAEDYSEQGFTEYIEKDDILQIINEAIGDDDNENS